MNNKQWQIGAVKIDGQAILAPMAGVSDIAYRLLAKEHGAALVCTEIDVYKRQTLHYLLENLHARGAKSVRLAALLNKPDRRKMDVEAVSYTHLKDLFPLNLEDMDL